MYFIPRHPLNYNKRLLQSLPYSDFSDQGKYIIFTDNKDGIQRAHIDPALVDLNGDHARNQLYGVKF